MVLFLSFCFLMTALTVIVGYYRGPNFALAVTSFCSLLIPRWVALEIASQPASATLVSCILALGYYCLHPKSTFRARLVALTM